MHLAVPAVSATDSSTAKHRQRLQSDFSRQVMRQQIAAKLGFTLQTATQAPMVKIEEI
jgi:hypothetical protein